MDYYLVNLEIQIGEFEKNRTVFLQAASHEEAQEKALWGECHGSKDDGTAEEVEGGISDMNFEFCYRVKGWKLVEPEDVPTLKRYLLEL